MKIILSKQEVTDIVMKHLAQVMPGSRFTNIRASFTADINALTKFHQVVEYFKAHYNTSNFIACIKEFRIMSQTLTPLELTSFPVISGATPDKLQGEAFSLAYGKYFMDAIRDGKF